ncbi:serine hydrolase [Tsukamurella sp. 1534]|uniref:serine hydrolase n=1 Tax=Tsukamurella sp. 1534 TaxID=1151061 RepID=UPI00031FC35C|nr:serine hydrolase [Tsukamurella sp. 1534]
MSTSTERAAIPAVLLAVALVTGCTFGDGGRAADRSAEASPTTPSSAPVPHSSSGPSGTPAGADTVLAQSLSKVDGDASVAVAGADGTVVARGGVDAAVAWSTVKVPLVMAALPDAPPGQQPQPTDLMRAAIVDSDNDAAEQIWRSLGQPADAGRAVQAVLQENGDARTVVQTRRVRPEYTAFGQTQWADGDAARFASRLPCTPAGRATFQLMKQVGGNQQWGLYRTAGVVGVKGGWGPGADGRYVVRQLGAITTQRGTTGFMLTVRPSDGTQASGQAALTRIASALVERLGELPTGQC